MFDSGDVVPLTVNIRDANGALANATAVTLTITLPDGTTTSPAPANPSVGLYQADYVTVMEGRHVVRWVATGNNASAYTDSFDVRPADPPLIMSLSAAKAALNLPGTETGDDEELRSLIEAVTATVEAYRGEVIAGRPISEPISVRDDGMCGIDGVYARGGGYWAGRSSRRLIFTRTPILSVTSITRPLDGVTWTSADLVIVDATSGVVSTYGAPFYGDLVASYVAGYQVVPANFTEAAKIILKHLWQTQQTPGMGSRVFGGEDVTGGLAGLGFAIPNRAAELLGGRAPVVA
jgi:hypothetical protein